MYHLDGKEVSVEWLMCQIVPAVVLRKKAVYYAYHWGVDIYWLHTLAPYWADEVKIGDKGLVIREDKVIEPFCRGSDE